MSGARWLFFLLATALTPVAVAQGDLWSQGVELRRQGRDEEALRVFEQAHAAERSSRTLAQVALAEQALGRWAAAAEHLARALAQPDAWVTSNRATLESAYAEIVRHVGQVEVLVDRAGAEIELDGRVVGRSPLAGPVPAAAGLVVLRVRAGGRVVAERSLHVTAGGLVRETVTVGDVPEAGGSALPVAGWITLGAGALAAAGMAVAWGLRESYAAQWNDDERCLVGTMTREESCGPHRASAEAAELSAIVLGASAGALIALGVVLVAVGGSQDGSQAALECAPALAGIVCGGRF